MPTDVANCKPDVVLINASQAAALLSISRAHFYDLCRNGQIGPVPVRFGRATRWNRIEMGQWIQAGCPNRMEWNIRRRTAKAGC